MSFEPVNELEKALMNAANNVSARPDFYKQLMISDIFIIGQSDEASENGTVVSKGSKISIQNFDMNNKIYIPVFSAQERLEFFISEPVQFLRMKSLDFFNLTKGADVFLNPGSDFGKEFNTNEIESILDGTIFKLDERYKVEKDERVLIGQPKNDPKELKAALIKYFKTNKQIKKAWLAHYMNQDRNEKPHTIIAIETNGNWDDISAELGLIIKTVDVPDPPVDVIKIDNNQGINNYFRKSSVPFYKKRLFL